jgi:hypothetical protein
MKRAGFFCVMLLLGSWVILPAPGQSSEHVLWVGQSLQVMQSVKPGMTRADVETIFVAQGGFSTRVQRTYAYRECHYFKVTVEFEPAPGAQEEESPKDKITSISKPFLDWSHSD